jgi:hypothetical protein
MEGMIVHIWDNSAWFVLHHFVKNIIHVVWIAIARDFLLSATDYINLVVNLMHSIEQATCCIIISIDYRFYLECPFVKLCCQMIRKR